MVNNSTRSKVALQCERMLYALILILVFEGIIRKLFPVLRTPVFFLKDALCLGILLKIATLKLTGIMAKLRSAWFIMFVMFLPLLHFTTFKDPILALFALKQYLLYIITGITVVVAFPENNEERFRRFLFFVALMICPTTIVAILQNALPPSHWLNLSVGGNSLEAFSAGGFLRVASTFSFTAQYSWFLVAASFFLATSFFLPPEKLFGLPRGFKNHIYFLLALMLVISAFITGGRTAVLGFASTFLLGLLFIFHKWPGFLIKGGLAIAAALIILTVIRSAKPEFFKAYDERSTGNAGRTHEEEMTTRILGGFTEWTEWFQKQDDTSIWFGNGLGVMSNGSAMVSTYASEIRENGFWTEGDIATTFWEGGIYLALIWYGFRLWMIFMCYHLWRKLRSKSYSMAAAIPLAYIVIQGIMAPLGIQPPLSIWWWFAIGIMAFISRAEQVAYTRSVSVNHSPAEQPRFFPNPMPGLSF